MTGRINAWCTCGHHANKHFDGGGPCGYITTTIQPKTYEVVIDDPGCSCGALEIAHIDLPVTPE